MKTKVKLALIDRFSPVWRERAVCLVRWHNDSLFAALKWAVPLGVLWWIVVGFFDLTTSIFAEPIRRHVTEQGWWKLPTQVVYFAVMYATMLALGLLTRWGFGRIIEVLERYIIDRVPGVSYVWRTLRNGVVSLKKTLEPGGPSAAGSYKYVAAFRYAGVIKILPVTSIRMLTSTLWDPSAPAPTNGEVFIVENGALTILRDAVPSIITTAICTTGIGLATWGDEFIRLEKEGGHTLADLIRCGEIVPHTKE